MPSLRACPLRIRLRNQPARNDADDGGEADAEQIDAIIMRRKQPRENEHAQQPQQRREDVGGQIDAGLSDQHNAASPAGSFGECERREIGLVLLDRRADGLDRRAGEGRDRERDVVPCLRAAKQLVQFTSAEVRLVPIADAWRARD